MRHQGGLGSALANCSHALGLGFAAAGTEEWKIPFQPVRQDFHGKKLYLLNRSCEAADGSIPSDTPANHPVGCRVFKAHPVPEQFALRMAAGDISTLPGGTHTKPVGSSLNNAQRIARVGPQEFWHNRKRLAEKEQL